MAAKHGHRPFAATCRMSHSDATHSLHLLLGTTFSFLCRMRGIKTCFFCGWESGTSSFSFFCKWSLFWPNYYFYHEADARLFHKCVACVSLACLHSYLLMGSVVRQTFYHDFDHRHDVVRFFGRLRPPMLSKLSPTLTTPTLCTGCAPWL